MTRSIRWPLFLLLLGSLALYACLPVDTSDDDDDDDAADDDTSGDDDTGDDDSVWCGDDPFYTDPGYLAAGDAPCREPLLVKLRDVIDGDTVYVDLEDGSYEKIRIIGIDTPEIGWDGEPDECYAQEARSFLSQQLSGGCFWLTFDADCWDPYDRLLVYVHTEAGFFEVASLEGGYADVMLFDPNTTFAALFYQALGDAQSSDAGMWGECY
ncbi:MAG: thermonuclease family protein [Myxococcota bacterium]|nr:thermonuclease family protein [Myxococcota bacterium]